MNKYQFFTVLNKTLCIDNWISCTGNMLLNETLPFEQVRKFFIQFIT